MSKLRIGVLCGVFDPVHHALLRPAYQALDSGSLDQVLVFPLDVPGMSSDPEDRWKMLVAACCSDPHLIPVRPSSVAGHTDVLSLLRSQYPDARLSMLPQEQVDRLSDAVRRDLVSGTLPDGMSIPVLEYIRAKGLYGVPSRIPASGIWLDRLFASLKPRRFAHSLAVADTARCMAVRFGEDPFKAEEAGLLHDCAKNLPLADMQRIARENGITDDPVFLESAALLHSAVGAFVASHDYGMTDPDVLEAISYHNTGHAGMSRLAMCVCLSDSIEPTRRTYPRLEQVRSLAAVSLEKALLLSLEGTAHFVMDKGLPLHPRTQETIAWLKTLPAVRE